MVLEEVSHAFGALTILTDICLKMRAGERRAILGANGAGKTTLLNLINGDLPTKKGRIYFFNEEISRLASYQRARRGLRRTYQISLLFNGLSLFDNLYLACRGVAKNRYSLLRPKHDDAAIIEARRILHIVRLDADREKIVAELSHGQQRQLEIGMALAGNPRFILFDEPAAGLSPTERSTLVEILDELPEHIGYILIEHDLEVAMRVVTWVTIMHNGKIFKEGSPNDIKKDSEVQEIYLGKAYGRK